MALQRLVGAVLVAAAICALSLPGSRDASPQLRLTSATTCSTAEVSLENGGFETPVVTPGFPRVTNDDKVPGWNATVTNFEIWPPGVTEGPPSGSGPYTAAEGDQFIELNATTPEGVFQPVDGESGTTLLIEAYHRSRTDATNTARMVLTGPGGQVRLRQDLTDGVEAWGRHDWHYRVPDGEPIARIGFFPLTGSGPDDSIGNFLDGVRVQTAGCVESRLRAHVVGPHVVPRVGDAIELRIDVTNVGGTAVRAPVIRDAAPRGTTYDARSLRVLTGPDRGPRTDAPDGDGAHANGDRIRIGAGTTLEPGARVAGRYRVTVSASAAGTRIVDDAATEYRLLDLAGTVFGETQRARTNTVSLGPVPSPAPSPTPSPSPSSSSSPSADPTSDPTSSTGSGGPDGGTGGPGGHGSDGAPHALPDTGSSTPPWLAPAGLVLLAVGAGVVVLARRRT
jgi:LPXTG-motif cell wall-anchored protein/uncharacterized repeat protein (TIGR01451 family)